MTLRNTRFRRALVAAFAASLVLSACGSGDDEPEATPSGGTPTIAAPGPLTIATSFGIDDLDPLENGFWGPEFGYVELLMRPEPSGTPSPWVLKELTNTSPTTWKLVLNKGVTFQSGRVLDGAALAQLLEFTGKENDSFKTISAIASATPSGPLEVTLTTSKPVPAMANVLADESNVPVFDVDAYKKYRTSKAKPEALLTAGLYTGPYAMTSLSTEVAQLAPLPTYWGGTPGLSSLTIKFVPEATARVQAVQAGEADIALYMPTTTAATLKGRADAFFVTGKPSGTAFALQLNNARSPYDDPLVRRAVHAAMDYRELAEDVLDGLADQAKSIFGPNMPYSVETQVTDLAEAGRLLDQAGWTAGADGTRSKGGKNLTMTLLTYGQQPDSETIGVALQSQLEKAGITVEVKQVPDITEARESGDFDGAIVGDSLFSFSLSPVDGLQSDLRTGQEENYQKVSDPELDAVLDKLQVEFDTTKQQELLREAQRIIHDKGLWAATVLRKPAVVTNAKWEAYPPPIANLWVNAKTAPAAG